MFSTKLQIQKLNKQNKKSKSILQTKIFCCCVVIGEKTTIRGRPEMTSHIVFLYFQFTFLRTKLLSFQKILTPSSSCQEPLKWMTWDKASSINDVTQFLIIFDTPSPPPSSHLLVIRLQCCCHKILDTPSPLSP